jgi:glycerol-1-phosphate dehydrogenase [NAD(P)+]
MSPIVPNKVIITEGALESLGDILSDYEYPIVATDEHIFSHYQDQLLNCTSKDMGWQLASDYHAGKQKDITGHDIIIGFGGGRSIDVAKLMAKDSGLEWISVPTAASHDGIASNVASIVQNGYRYSKKCKAPSIVVADTSIIDKAPAKLKRAGLGDIVSKASSLPEWRLASEEDIEALDEEIYMIVDGALRLIMENDDTESLVRAEIECGKAMSMFGSSRPCSGTEHAISHAMDRRNHTLHGLQVAFATPLSVHFLERTVYTTYDAVQVQQFLKGNGIPSTLEEMELNMDLLLDDIHHALRIMKKRGRYSILEHLNIQNTDIKNALNELAYC